jgi:hypothetical protein
MIFQEFFSKHELLRVFQITQQMDVTLAIWMLRLACENCGIHQKNYAKDPVRVVAPTTIPTTLQTY